MSTTRTARAAKACKSNWSIEKTATTKQKGKEGEKKRNPSYHTTQADRATISTGNQRLKLLTLRHCLIEDLMRVAMVITAASAMTMAMLFVRVSMPACSAMRMRMMAMRGIELTLSAMWMLLHEHHSIDR